MILVLQNKNYTHITSCSLFVRAGVQIVSSDWSYRQVFTYKTSVNTSHSTSFIFWASHSWTLTLSLSPSIDLSKKITNNFGFNFSCSHSFFHRNLIVYLTYSRRWTHEIQQKLYISWVIHRISAIEFYLIQYGGSNLFALWSFSCWLNNHVLVQKKSGCLFWRQVRYILSYNKT